MWILSDTNIQAKALPCHRGPQLRPTGSIPRFSTVQTKTTKMRKTKTIYSELAVAWESTIVTCVLADWKAGRGVGKLYCGKKRRLHLCPDWRLLAWKSCRRAN